jgi:hypothetical protein
MLLLLLVLPSVAYSASASASFRVIPCSSVANASAYSSLRGYASVFSVKFRVNPWQMLPLLLSSMAILLLCQCLPCDFTKYFKK